MVGRPRATHTSTAPHAIGDSHCLTFWPRPTIVPHDQGLAASPPVRDKIRVGRAPLPSPLYPPRPAHTLLLKRRVASIATSARTLFHVTHVVIGTAFSAISRGSDESAARFDVPYEEG